MTGADSKGDLSQHFSRSEFACHCGCGFGLGEHDVSAELVRVLEGIRAHFDAPIMVVSGCRCARHNRTVGGARFSRHVLGQAADIRVQGVVPKAVADFLCERYARTFGVGRYGTWTHVDVRATRARWGAN